MFNVNKELKAKEKMFLSAKEGSKQLMIEQIEAFDFSVNTQGKAGICLLHESIISNHIDIFDYLLSCKDIDVNIKNDQGQTALMLAVKINLRPYVEKLLDKNALMDTRAHNKDSALIMAAINDNTDILRMLLDVGADIDIKDSEGKTALIWTAYRGYYDATKLLLEYGADIYVKSINGYDASFLAIKNGQVNVRELIEEAKKGNLKVKTPVLIEKNDWIITGKQEISHISSKIKLGRTITEIFNFQARTLITIIENNKTQVETMVKEPLSDIDVSSISVACQKYEDMTGENIEMFNRPKQVQTWNNLNE